MPLENGASRNQDLCNAAEYAYCGFKLFIQPRQGLLGPLSLDDSGDDRRCGVKELFLPFPALMPFLYISVDYSDNLFGRDYGDAVMAMVGYPLVFVCLLLPFAETISERNLS